MSRFFILGLPRSRTLWFSELFTFNDIECAHEYFSVHEEREFIDGVRGYCDTNPLTRPNYMDSPVLIIRRKAHEAVQSICKAFDCPDGIDCWKTTVENYMDVYSRELDAVYAKNVMIVNYEDIDEKLTDIWEHLLPDIPVDNKRIAEYTNKIIKTENRDLTESLIHTFGSIENVSRMYDKNILIAQRITDYTQAIYLCKECFYEMSEDNVSEYIPDIMGEYWIGFYNQDEMVGGARFHQVNNATWEAHAFMLKKYRFKYAIKACHRAFEWMLLNTDVKKINATAPTRFKNVAEFLKSAGFKKEGINRQSYTKDGKLWDIWNYGITVDEIKGVLKWEQRQL